MSDTVLIIGGGVVGVSAAYCLARQGVAVTLIDKGEIGSGSSYGNAGLLCPCHASPIAGPGVLSQGLKWLLDAESPFYIRPRLDLDLIAWLWRFRAHCNQAAVDAAIPLLRDMSRASLDLYRAWVEQEQLACDFEQNGGLALYRTERGFDHGREEAAHMERFGLRVAVLDAAAARALEPAIHPDILGAVHFQEDATITPHLFVEGLARAAEAHGVTILPHTELLGFDVQGGRITAVRTTRGDMAAGQVILAAGAWSTPIARDLGLSLPMQPAKGYSVTVRRPERSPGRYLYLGEARVAITPMGQHLRFAGTLELAGFDLSINQRRVNAILRAAKTYLADGRDHQVVEIWRGLRPCSPDGLPYIGRSPRIKNLLVGTGHATLGMATGTVTGQLLAELAGGQQPSLALDAFRVDRFA